MGCGSSKVPDVEEPSKLPQFHHDDEEEVEGLDGDNFIPLKSSALAPAIVTQARYETFSKESSNSLMYSSFGSKASSSAYSASVTSSEVDQFPDITHQDAANHHDVDHNDIAHQDIVTAMLMSKDEELYVSPASHPTTAKSVSGIAIRTSYNYECEDDDQEYVALTTPNLQQISSTQSLQDDLDRANSKSAYKVGGSEASVTSSIRRELDELAGFHNYDRHVDMLKNHSQRSNFSREDSGISGISGVTGISSLYHSELSERSNKTSADSGSGYNSTLSTVSNLSPIILSKYDDRLILDATAELHHEGSDCENSTVHDVLNHDDSVENDCADNEDGENVEEWMAYIRKMSTDRNSNVNDETSLSGSDTDDDYEFSATDVGGTEEEVEGYFRYVTAEGHEIWILLDHRHPMEEYNDDVVNEMIMYGKNSGTEPDTSKESVDGAYLSPFHMSREDAIQNVSKVREFKNKQEYEKALLRQQEEQSKKLQAIRQNTATSLATDEEGNNISSMSVADRKKLLWNSSGKLETRKEI